MSCRTWLVKLRLGTRWPKQKGRYCNKGHDNKDQRPDEGRKGRLLLFHTNFSF